MNQELEQPHGSELPDDAPPVPLTQALSFGLGTFASAGILDLAAHLGPTGLVVGGIVAYAASRHGPDLYAKVREALPSRTFATGDPPSKPAPAARKRPGRSVLDRAGTLSHR